MKKTFALFFAMLCSTLFFTNKTLAAEYALQLCGIQVTDTNKDNITGPYITGHASYNPETNTLTLDNVSILIDNPYCALHNGIKDLTIYVTGDNLLWCSGWGTALYSAKDLTITGPGTLRAIAAGGGVELRSCNLTISNTTVEASSHNSAITGLDNNTEILTINNSTVRAYGELEGSIICLKSLILNDCVISAPEVAAFNENLNGVALNGSIVRFGEVEICPIDGIEDLAADNINIYSKDLTIRIENAQGMTATIINTKGQIVSKGKLNSDAESISIPTAGVYVVSLGAKSKKVVVR